MTVVKGGVSHGRDAFAVGRSKEPTNMQYPRIALKTLWLALLHDPAAYKRSPPEIERRLTKYDQKPE